MTIILLSQQEYDTLIQIQKQFPALTFQNEGYEYIDRRKFTPEEKTADSTVASILHEHIKHFVRFDNFRVRKDGELTVRFQYHWSDSFTGVGYLSVRELLHGFDKPDEVTFFGEEKIVQE